MGIKRNSGVEKMIRMSKKIIDNWEIVLDNLNKDELILIKGMIDKMLVDKFDEKEEDWDRTHKSE